MGKLFRIRALIQNVNLLIGKERRLLLLLLLLLYEESKIDEINGSDKIKILKNKIDQFHIR